jgi:hypothetical protein
VIRFFVTFPRSGLSLPCKTLAEANARVRKLRGRNVTCFVEAKS